MNFRAHQDIDDVQDILPQFSELRGLLNPSFTTSSTMEFTSGGNMQGGTAQGRSVYTAGAREAQPEMQTEMSQSLNPALALWSNRLQQICDPAHINIPNYNQTNPILDMQANNLQFFENLCTSQINAVKPELSVLPKEQKNPCKESDIQLKQRQATQYFQKLQATSLPHTLQHLIKQQSEQAKKMEDNGDKMEYTQNILNIPNIFRNIQLQNSPDLMFGISSDLPLHVETNQQEDEKNFQPVVKVEQQVQTDSPKFEKKLKFRAKFGEIKVSYSNDGTTIYCCPECNIGLPDKADMEQHVRAHLQERKYECKLCGAMLKRKEHLDQHMRGHSNDRPFKCDVCHKGFKRNEHLTRHNVTHSGYKKFLCTMCQKAFSRKDHLSKHMQTHLGNRKGKKEDSYYISQKDKFFERRGIDMLPLPNQQVSYVTKDDLKQEALVQCFQNFQKNQKELL